MNNRKNQIEDARQNRLNNLEKRKQYDRNRYAANPQKFIDNDRKVRQTNPIYYKEKDRKWRQNNPERCKYHASKHRNHDITIKEWQSCLKYFNYQCAYCGMTLNEHKTKYKEQLHKEHVDDNGYNDIRNCVPGCKTCNSRKHESNLEEWYLKQKFFSEERLQKIILWTTNEYKEYIEDKLPYKFKRKKIYNEDNTYYTEHQLWSIDEKRNLIDIIFTAKSKKELKEYINHNKI